MNLRSSLTKIQTPDLLSNVPSLSMPLLRSPCPYKKKNGGGVDRFIPNFFPNLFLDTKIKIW